MPCRFRRCAPILLAAAGLVPAASAGGVASAQFQVSLTIAPDCSASSAPLAFPVSRSLASAVTQTVDLRVQCSRNTAFNVGLSAGDVPGSTVTNRLLGGANSTVRYQLFSDSAHTRVWGDGTAATGVSGTGRGNAQSLTIYGLVPAQATPAPGTYSAIVTASVTF